VAARAFQVGILRLYMDVHVKASITVGLRGWSIGIVTAQEETSSRLDDEVVVGDLLDPIAVQKALDGVTNFTF